MIRSIEIENLRGIRQGRLDDLTSLVVLTGRNATGKSTVLEALSIGGADDIPGAISHVVARRSTLRSGADWLVGRSSRKSVLEIGTEDRRRTIELQRLGKCFEPHARSFEARSVPVPGPYTSIQCSTRSPDLRKHQAAPGWIMTFSPSNESALHGTSGPGPDLPPWGGARFVEFAGGEPLTRLYSRDVQSGRRSHVVESLRRMLPEVANLEILTDPEEKPQLHVVHASGAVPIDLVGDGLRALVRTILVLSDATQGLVLVEEPELHQHPGAIWETARAIWDAVGRGLQIVLSTHSLEMIDALVGRADSVAGLSVFTLRLEGGSLNVGRTAGEDVRFSRQTIEADLR